MTEQVELSDFSREQLEEIIRRTQRRQSLSGQRDVVKATAHVVRRASEKLEEEIREASQRAAVVKSVDVCFVLDCTVSMEDQIKAAKEKIVEIQVRIVRCLGHGGNIRFSVVGYRDYDDTKHFEILPFTEDVKTVESFLSKLKATGGGDVCEDVIGGLSQALQLNWQARTRILYLILDAPPHGARFKREGSRFGDNHDSKANDKHQWRTTDKVMKKSLALKLNLVLLNYSVPVHSRNLLAKTIEVFSELRQTPSSRQLQTLCFEPENTADDFVKCILASTKETLSSTLTLPASDKTAESGSSEASLSLDVMPDVRWKDWKNWPVQRVLVTSVNVIALTSNAPPSQLIQHFHIRAEPFASGSMRYAFPVTSDDGTMRFVLKVHKDTDHDQSSVALADVTTQAYAKLLAEEFSQRCCKLSPDLAPIQFLDAWAVELPKWNVATHATLEPFVDGVFQKYTSNNGFISQEAAIAEAFCHFSWCHSGGQMMVTDLQGFQSAVFTDPQIHCVKKGFFGRGNLGKQGMDQFFLGHCCNDLCRGLGLKESPIQLGFESDNGSIVSDKSVLLSRSSSYGSLLCVYCNNFVDLGKQEYIDLMNQYQAVLCPPCKEKVKESLATTRCRSCNQPFEYSMHTTGVKGSSVPYVCRSCELGEVWNFID